MDELIEAFNNHGIRYLLMGGQAMRLNGMPRFSMDWDFFIPPRDQENLTRLNALLREDLDIPVEPLGPRGENFVQTYQTRWGIIQFHLGVPGVPKYDEAEKQAVLLKTETGTPVRCLCGLHLLASKKAAGRPQDQLDLDFLEAKQKAGKLV
jgi:hypothetical protein